MAERLFLFVQFEFPWELGPPDGRYLLRGGAERDPRHVVVLSTAGATRRPEGILRGRRQARPRPAPPQPEPSAVAVARATVIDPLAVASEAQARSWLGQLDPEHETSMAAAVLGEMLFAYRIATADPYIQEPSPARALAIRAGWGEGEQVADGHWRHALELPWKGQRTHRRTAVLRPQERLTLLLSDREAPLLCEELALRARRDLDQGRLALAAAELRSAYTAALAELSASERPDLAGRLAELGELSGSLAPPAEPGGLSGNLASPAEPGGLSRSLASPAEPDQPTVRLALERLEATLRARTAPGFGAS